LSAYDGDVCGVVPVLASSVKIGIGVVPVHPTPPDRVTEIVSRRVSRPLRVA
jgi:hypothetical protein